MPQYATLPRAERVVRGDMYMRYYVTQDLTATAVQKTVPVGCPLYLDARKAAGSLGLMIFDSVGSMVARLGFDGALYLRGAVEYYDDEILYGTYDTLMCTDLSSVRMAQITNAGDFIVKSIVNTPGSLTLEKATGDLTEPRPLNYTLGPASSYLLKSETLPFIQTIDSAGNCTSKLSADGTFETVAGVFTGMLGVGDTVYGGFKF